MLKSRSNRAAGFTLIEMVVTMGIFALLVAITIPTMRTWVANTKLRTTAELLQNGIRLAQTEALRRSRIVVFTLTNTPNPPPGFTGGTNGAFQYWAAQTIPPDPTEAAVVVGWGPLAADSSPVTILYLPVSVCFNSVGRVVSEYSTGVPGALCLAPFYPAGNVSSSVIQWAPEILNQPPADHPLAVEVTLSGKIHMCDPTQTLSAANPYGC